MGFGLGFWFRVFGFRFLGFGFGFWVLVWGLAFICGWARAGLRVSV